jgi:hypothetical protein
MAMQSLAASRAAPPKKSRSFFGSSKELKESKKKQKAEEEAARVRAAEAKRLIDADEAAKKAREEREAVQRAKEAAERAEAAALAKAEAERVEAEERAKAALEAAKRLAQEEAELAEAEALAAEEAAKAEAEARESEAAAAKAEAEAEVKAEAAAAAAEDLAAAVAPPASDAFTAQQTWLANRVVEAEGSSPATPGARQPPVVPSSLLSDGSDGADAASSAKVNTGAAAAGGSAAEVAPTPTTQDVIASRPSRNTLTTAAPPAFRVPRASTRDPPSPTLTPIGTSTSPAAFRASRYSPVSLRPNQTPKKRPSREAPVPAAAELKPGQSGGRTPVPAPPRGSWDTPRHPSCSLASPPSWEGPPGKLPEERMRGFRHLQVAPSLQAFSTSPLRYAARQTRDPHGRLRSAAER